MENQSILKNTFPRIALIVPYIGSLPPYFPAWLQSAEENPDVDFFIYTDQTVRTEAPNIHVHQTTLEELRQRFADKLNRKVNLPNAYRLVDFKITYGLAFEDELKDFDFWGYCDVDLVFGHIRSYCTEERLNAYDRLYPWGHFSIYRNNERMKHLFEEPGSVFTLDEIFNAPDDVKCVSADELPVINRICLKNHVSWYFKRDFININMRFPNRMDASIPNWNYPVQAFYRLNGRTFRRYVKDDATSPGSPRVEDDECFYIHFMRKRPAVERLAQPGEAMVLTPERFLIVRPEELTPENMLRWNPLLDEKKGAAYYQRAHLKDVAVDFLKRGWSAKRYRLKYELYRLREVRGRKSPY